MTTGKWSWILEIFLQLELTEFIRGLYAGVQNKEESGITSTFSAQDNERREVPLTKMTNTAVKGKGGRAGAGTDVREY